MIRDTLMQCDLSIREVYSEALEWSRKEKLTKNPIKHNKNVKK